MWLKNLVPQTFMKWNVISLVAFPDLSFLCKVEVSLRSNSWAFHIWWPNLILFSSRKLSFNRVVLALAFSHHVAGFLLTLPVCIRKERD